jgi:hypothetical protein
MTESEWRAGSDPAPMLGFVLGVATERKLRLFAVACCRRIWPRLTDARSRHAVELAERSADQPVREAELDAASGEAEGAYEDSLTDDEGEAVGEDDPGADAAAAASYASSPGRPGEEHFAVVLEGAQAASPVGAVQERAAQASLARCVFGNPFRPPRAIDPGLLARDDARVVKLARAAYEDRLLPAGHLHADRLAVLADALEEAGGDADLLAHLREPGPHWRGCWAVDAVLGKR